jgi:FixJ family two-component response regulator
VEGTQQLVVVIEDDIGMRQALQRWLRAAGYRARAYESAEALLGENGACDADCLVLDVRLPGASGIELYEQLGSARPPAVFVTSHDEADVRNAVARLGGTAVLPKPFLGHELTAAIACATAADKPGDVATRNLRPLARSREE